MVHIISPRATQGWAFRRAPMRQLLLSRANLWRPTSRPTHLVDVLEAVPSLGSAPKIFSAFADALVWVFQYKGVVWQLHNFQDSSCATALELAMDTCRHLGVPIAPHNREAPTTQLTILGIQVDTISMTLSLLQEKLAHIVALVLSWRSRNVASKGEIQSFIGHLSHAAVVVLSGRTFLRRMINVMKIV